LETLLEAIANETLAFVEDVKKQIADGVSFSDALPLFDKLQNRLMAVAQKFDVVGPNKKDAVLAGLENFFDLVVVPYDIPWVPAWAETVIESTARAKIRPVFGPLIDKAVSFAKYLETLLVNPWRKAA